MNKMRPIMIAVAAGLAARAALAQQAAAPPVPTPAEVALKPVKLMVVEADQATLKRQFFGKVAARRTVDMAFQVRGQIETFPVIAGS